MIMIHCGIDFHYFAPLFLLPALTIAICDICEHGGDITKLDKKLTIPGYPYIETCKTLKTFLPFVNQRSRDCQLLKALGPLCGCNATDNPCTLCVGKGNETVSPQHPDKKLPFLAPLFNGIVPTCEVTESFLLGMPQTSDFCLASRGVIGGVCGCPFDYKGEGDSDYNERAPPCSTCPGNKPIVTRHREFSIPGLPLQNCGQLDDFVRGALKDGQHACDLVQRISPTKCGCKGPTNPCTLCKNGSPPSAQLRDKKVPFARQVMFGILPTCDLVDAYIAGYEADDEVCELAQMSIGSYCGCPARENHCVFCPAELQTHTEEMKDHDPGLLELDPSLRIQPTCELIEATQYQLASYGDDCFFGKFSSFHCGCNGGGSSTVFGITSKTREEIIAWVPRVAALMTLVGTTAIQSDVLRNKMRRKRVYNRLILFMSVFDAMTAISFGLGSLVVPKRSIHLGISLGFSHAYGTKGTCIAQGWFSLFGFTSIYSNIVLSIYYKLTILDGWREPRLRKNQWWMFGVPLSVGFVIACAAIPLYEISMLGCFIVPYQYLFKYSIPLLFVPCYAAVIILVGTSIYIYFRMKTQHAKAEKWKFPRNGGGLGAHSQRSGQDPLEHQSMISSTRGEQEGPSPRSKILRAAYWQAVSYTLSYCFTWATLGVGFLLVQPIGFSHFPFWVLFSYCIPINGFNNAIIYFRPRLVRWWNGHFPSPDRREQIPSTFTATSGFSAVSSRDRRFPYLRWNQMNNYELLDSDPSAYIAAEDFEDEGWNRRSRQPVRVPADD